MPSNSSSFSAARVAPKSGYFSRKSAFDPLARSLVQAPMRRLATLTRHQTRVALVAPGSDKALELTNADAQTFRAIALTQFTPNRLVHKAGSLSFLDTHCQYPAAHAVPTPSHAQKGTF
jgi:hypothetical protein